MSDATKYGMGVPRTDFFFTNPVAAQQAADSLKTRLGYEQAQDEGNRQQAEKLNETAGANTRAVIGGLSGLGGSVLNSQAAGREGAANRTSAEKIAGMQEAVRQHRTEDAAWQQNEQAADLGEQTAGMLNKDPNAKVDRKFVWLNPQTGQWESRFNRKPRPLPPGTGSGNSGMAVPQAAMGGAGGPMTAPTMAIPGRAFGDSGVPFRPGLSGNDQMGPGIAEPGAVSSGQMMGPAAPPPAPIPTPFAVPYQFGPVNRVAQATAYY